MKVRHITHNRTQFYHLETAKIRNSQTKHGQYVPKKPKKLPDIPDELIIKYSAKQAKEDLKAYEEYFRQIENERKPIAAVTPKQFEHIIFLTHILNKPSLIEETNKLIVYIL